MTDEQLMTYVDAAFDFIERTTGALPGRTKQVQELLAVVGIHEEIERIVHCGDIVWELKYKPQESED
jgi:hypothetical protein